MTEIVKLLYTPTTQDHVQGMQAILWRIGRLRFILPLQGVVFVLGILLLALFDEFVFVAILLVALPPFTILSVLVLPQVMLRWRIRKDERLRTEVMWELSEDRIMIKSKFAESYIDWSAFREVRETKHLYLFVTGSAIYLPKRVFESSDQEAVFRGIVKRHVNKVTMKAGWQFAPPDANTRRVERR